MIWEAVIFGTILLVALGCVIISFIFLYQRKRYRHREEVVQMQETFTKEMLHSKTEIQEQTLQHIATEIHDNFNPTLSVINLNLASVIPGVEEPVKETILDTKGLVRNLMAEMRALSNSLNTDQISRIGFTRALEQYIDRLRKTGFYTINFINNDDELRLQPNKEIILLRMCQEVLNNIVKHAEAKNITIRVTHRNRMYSVEITDDGKGFDPEITAANPEKQDSTGLRNLRNRALIIDADLSVKSTPGAGTTIIISVQL